MRWSREINGRSVLLFLAVAAIAVVWTVLLPAVGRQRQVRDHIQFLEDRGIDPAALFYTDLEAMSRVESRVQEAVRENPTAFWVQDSR